MSQALAGAAVGTLARREARRTARHPVYLVLLLYFLVLGGVQAASLGPAPWTMSPGYYDDVRIAAGSHGWHAVHLLGLGLLAAALLRYPAHRRPLLALGAAVLGSAHRTPITPGEGQGKGRNSPDHLRSRRADLDQPGGWDPRSFDAFLVAWLR